MAGKIQYEKTFISPGDGVCIDVIGVANISAFESTDTTVQVTTPVGLTYVSSTLAKGSFDEPTGVWTIGTLIAGETLVASQFCYTVSTSVLSGVDLVSGDCLAPYQWDIAIQGACIDNCAENNNYTITLSGLTCCEVVACTEGRGVIDLLVGVPGFTGVTLSSTLDVNRKVVVHRNGLLQDSSQYTISTTTITFGLPFAASGGGAGVENIIVEYFNI